MLLGHFVMSGFTRNSNDEHSILCFIDLGGFGLCRRGSSTLNVMPTSLEFYSDTSKMIYFLIFFLFNSPSFMIWIIFLMNICYKETIGFVLLWKKSKSKYWLILIRCFEYSLNISIWSYNRKNVIAQRLHVCFMISKASHCNYAWQQKLSFFDPRQLLFLTFINYLFAFLRKVLS